MSKKCKSWTLLIGRVLISLIFVMSGMGKILDFNGTLLFMESAGITVLTTFLLVIAIIVELLGGLSLLFGYKTKFGSLLLIGFLIVTTLVFHINFADQNQMAHFMKNIAILGGLMYVYVFGTGKNEISKSNL